MIEDVQIIEAAQRAERLKAVMPQSSVSADAIFTAIVLGKRKQGRPAKERVGIPTNPHDPPEWFAETLAALKGRAVTCSQFLFAAGRVPNTKADRNAVGRWLRAAGRQPMKKGAARRQVFCI